jgi:uncharacterized protein YcfJ
MRALKLIPTLAIVCCLVSCDHMNHTDQNVLGGGLLGAAAGAGIGALVATHGAGAGALIGAGVGLLGGYLYDRAKYDDR